MEREQALEFAKTILDEHPEIMGELLQGRTLPPKENYTFKTTVWATEETKNKVDDVIKTFKGTANVISNTGKLSRSEVIRKALVIGLDRIKDLHYPKPKEASVN